MNSSSTCEPPRRRGLAAALAGVVFFADIGAGAAAPAAGDRAAAEALFKEGRARIEAGDDAGGCPKFAESMALYPSTGTALNLAKCHERAGALTAARAAYQAALEHNDKTRDARRRRGFEALAREGLAALELRLPRLRLVVEDAPAGLAVTRDGEPVPDSALGEAVLIDPGPHEIKASAPGHRPVRRTIELAEGETETVILKLAPARVEATDPTRDAPRRQGAPAWAWATGGVGLGLVGASLYFLADRQAAIADLKAHCREVTGGTYCAPDYDFAADNARKNRDLGLFIGLGGVGLAAVTAAIVVIARSHKRGARRGTTATPWLTPSAGGLAVAGRF